MDRIVDDDSECHRSYDRKRNPHLAYEETPQPEAAIRAAVVPISMLIMFRCPMLANISVLPLPVTLSTEAAWPLTYSSTLSLNAITALLDRVCVDTVSLKDDLSTLI